MSHSKRLQASLQPLSLALGIALGLCIPSIALASHFGTTTNAGNPKEPPESQPPCGGGVECPEGQAPDAGCTDNPINLRTGAKHYKVTDLEVPGEQAIRLTRFYDSQSDYDSALGHGWAFIHDRRLYEYPDNSIIIRYHCGQRTRFVPAGGGFEAEIGGLRGDLEEVPGSGYTFTYADGRVDHYDLAGRLTAYQDRQGNQLRYRYDPAGKLPLIGASKYAVDPDAALIVAYSHRLTRIEAHTPAGTATGRYIDFTYNSATGRLVTATDQAGRIVTYHHDITPDNQTLGNLIRVEGLDNIDATYEYTDPQDRHNLTTYKSSASSTAQINQYDALDRVKKQTYGARILDITYPIEQTHTIVTNTLSIPGQPARSAVTETFFDLQGYVEKVIDPEDNETRYSYTAEHWVDIKSIWENTPGGLIQTQAIDYDYSTEGLKEQETVTLASGETLTKTWTHDHGRIKTQTLSSTADARVFYTEYSFYRDGAGRPTNIETLKRRKDDASFQTTSYTYDARNRLKTTTLPDGVKIINTYTGNNLTGIHYQASGSALPQLAQTFDYDSVGRRTHSTDAKGNLTQTEYDAQGRVNQVTNALNEQTILTYTGEDLTGLEIGKTASAPGVQYRLSYTPEHWLETVERLGAGGQYQLLAEYTYDSDGNRRSASDGDSLTTTFDYDLNNRLIQVTDADGNPTQFAYDARGNRTQLIDANNHATKYVYDALDRLIKTEQLGISPPAITQYRYDANDNLTRVTDPENNQTQYVYDALSQLRQVIQPLSQTVTHEYDARGRIDHSINARGHKLDYDYEPWGPVKAIDYYASTSATTPDYSKTFAYDHNGNLSQTADTRIQAGALYSISYDALNRPDQTTVSYIPSRSLTLDNDYDRFGNREQLILDAGVPFVPQRHGYIYDITNRLIQAELPNADPLTLNYRLNDRLETLNYPNNLSTTYTYQDAGPVQRITVTGAQGVLEDIVYGYDPALNIDTRTDSDGQHNYDYDGINRLIQALHPTTSNLPQSEDFDYDLVGNREDPTNPANYEYDDNNRLTEHNATAYQYDADGNLSQRGTKTYDHDMDSRLTQYSDTTTTATYQYDPLGRRISKTVGSTTTYFVWDGNNLLAEYDQNGNRTKRYAYLPGNHLPTQYEDANGTYWVHGDHLQAPRLLTDAQDPDSTVVWQASFLAYGETVINDDPDNNGTPVTFNPRFPGQYQDSESGLYYNYFRHYDPSIGRYITSDPIGLTGGLNTYEYVGGNPVIHSDSYGLAGPATPIVVGIAAFCRLNPQACAAATAALAAAVNNALNVGTRDFPLPDRDIWWPDRASGYWVCKARADCNDNIPGNCPENPKHRFAFGGGSAKDLGTARNIAKANATSNLQCQPKHVSCKCTGPKGEQYSGGC